MGSNSVEVNVVVYATNVKRRREKDFTQREFPRFPT